MKTNEEEKEKKPKKKTKKTKKKAITVLFMRFLKGLINWEDRVRRQKPRLRMLLPRSRVCYYFANKIKEFTDKNTLI